MPGSDTYLQWHEDAARKLLSLVMEHPDRSVYSFEDEINVSHHTFVDLVGALNDAGYLQTSRGRSADAEVLPPGQKWLQTGEVAAE